MPPMKRPSSKPVVVRKPAAAASDFDVVRKPSAVDWRQYDKECDANSSQSVPSDSDSEANAEPDLSSKRAKTSSAVIVPGQRQDGSQLPVEDHSPYTAQQIYVGKKFMKAAPAIKKQFDEGNREERKVLINSLVPRDVAYSAVFDMSKAQAWITRQMATKKTEGELCKQTHHTWSWWLKEWGEELVEKAKQRKDLVEDADGLWYERSKELTRRVTKTDENTTALKQEGDGKQGLEAQTTMQIDWQ
ncbi:unnamed protein product, partial [Prorocentrum cordatum]